MFGCDRILNKQDFVVCDFTPAFSSDVQIINEHMNLDYSELTSDKQPWPVHIPSRPEQLTFIPTYSGKSCFILFCCAHIHRELQTTWNIH